MTPREELIKFIEDLGVSKVKIAEILDVKYSTIVKMLSEKELRHTVNAGHFEKVKDFYKKKIELFAR